MDTAPDEKVPSKFREMEDLKSKNLYICIDVWSSYPYSSWVVHEIRMNDVLSNSKTLRYKELANVFGKLPVAVGCGVFKSRILIGGGVIPKEDSLIGDPVTSVHSFESGSDSTDGKLKLEHFSKFLGGKAEPLLVEMHGKLYALAGDRFMFPGKQYFEVFDPSCGEWSPLSAPPFWEPGYPIDWTRFSLAYVVTDTSILVSCANTPVFCFDVTKPDAGWLQTSGEAFPFQGRTLVVDDSADDGFLIFALHCENERENEYGWRLPPTRLPNIPVYHMSNDYHSLIHIATVEMPVSDQLAHKFGAPETYSFVNLGGQRVCLALSAFSITLDDSLAEREKLSILVATFEYKVETSKKRTWESSPVSCSLSYEFLTTPGILEYDIPQHPEISPSPRTVITRLLGAFVL